MEPTVIVPIIVGAVFTLICVGYVVYACKPRRGELEVRKADDVEKSSCDWVTGKFWDFLWD